MALCVIYPMPGLLHNKGRDGNFKQCQPGNDSPPLAWVTGLARAPENSYNHCSSPCVKPPDRNQEIGQDLRYTFLNSSWHTDAKKIPEKLIYRRPLACFFRKTNFFWKIFFRLKLIWKVQKSFLEEKNFLWKFSKTLRKILHRKKAVKFF